MGSKKAFVMASKHGSMMGSNTTSGMGSNEAYVWVRSMHVPWFRTEAAEYGFEPATL